MAVVIVETQIAVPVAVCFDGARDIGLHCRTASFTRERAVGGITQGLIGLGESVIFEAVHFGVRQQLSATVTEFDPPYSFTDTMIRGAFQSMRHMHEFVSTAQAETTMRDTLDWTAPFGLLGRMADALFLRRYMQNFLARRNAALKTVLESRPQF